MADENSTTTPKAMTEVEKGESVEQMEGSKVFKHEIDADEGLQAIQSSGEEVVIDEETNRRLLRKIDWNLMPLMCLVYGLNFLDKTSLSYASIMGLKGDLNLKGDNYQWLGSMFYFGYIAWEFPTSRILQRLPLAKYTAFNVIMWGLILCLFATTSNFGGAVVIRFFLGWFEAAVTPGFALMTSQWYTKSEQGLRTGIWFCFNGFAQIFGGLVAYGFARGSANAIARGEPWSIEAWKSLFIFCGLLTSVSGLLFLWRMPDSQLNAKFLSPEDRKLAIHRIKVNNQGIGNKKFKWYQVREAFTDPMIWGFVFYGLVANIPNGGITNFFSELIVSFGYTPEESLLYGTPAGAVEIIALLVCGYLGDRFGQRLLISIFGMLWAILGIALIVAVPLSNPVPRLIGYYFTQAAPAPFVALLSLIATNVAGWTKKATVAALYLVAYCVGNIIGPQTFRPADAPQYRNGQIIILACWSACVVDILFIWWYARNQNAKKAVMRSQEGYVKVENQQFLDLTDRENPEFIYSL